MHRRGFTLIELLVVIAIIAILAAILFPVFLKAKRAGQSAACLGNTKQIGEGMMLYCNDWQETFPVTNFYDGFSRGIQSRWGYGLQMWADLIFPYVKNYNVFTCPARPQRTTTANPGWGQGLNYDFGWGKQTRPMGYALNCYIDRSWSGPAGSRQGMKQVLVRRPSQKVLVGEMSSGISQMAIWHIYWVGKCADAHEGRGNWVFCDGHAKALKVSQTVVPKLMWNIGDVYPMVLFPWAPQAEAKNEKEAQDYAVARLGADQ